VAAFSLQAASHLDLTLSDVRQTNVRDNSCCT
jgi:hypothetical protein